MVCLISSSHQYIPLREAITSRRRRRRRRACLGIIGGGPRVFVVSDLHTDYSDNMRWVKCLSSTHSHNHLKDVLLVAGDVAESFDNFLSTMSLFKDAFRRVFFVPGNHDLWCRSHTHHHSLEKLDALLDACRQLGVETGPAHVDGLGIIPLFSWYHESFDREEDITGIRIPSLEMACKDFHACKWPADLSSRDTSLSLYFDAMNEKNQDAIKEIRRTCSQIITFSHFVPRNFLWQHLVMFMVLLLHLKMRGISRIKQW